MNPELEHLTFQLADVSIHAVAAGPQDGPLDHPLTWISGILVRLGEPKSDHSLKPVFRVAVPDQRGYNRSSKPKDWRAL